MGEELGEEAVSQRSAGVGLFQPASRWNDSLRTAWQDDKTDDDDWEGARGHHHMRTSNFYSSL